MLIKSPIPFRYIFNKVRTDVFKVLIFSAIFHIFKYYIAELPAIPHSLPTILGTCISLLLAFNLNQSYDRWWEARKIWGAIVNDSRSLILLLKGFSPEHPLVSKIGLRQIEWCYTLGETLRSNTEVSDDQRELLTDDDSSYVRQHNNAALALLMLHSHDLNEIRKMGAISEFQQVEVMSAITRLCDSMGMAERIKTTVFPMTYRIFVHLFIYLFLIILSMALVQSIGFLEVPILTLMASTFFLIEKTASQMQDPFSNQPTDTPMTAIARTIEINLKQLLGEADVPQPVMAERYYLM